MRSNAARRDSIRKHAAWGWTCPVCQAVIHGNGGKSSHKRAHAAAGTAHPAWTRRYAAAAAKADAPAKETK